MHVIGTAGHVDHGKSTLVKALTGIDPDRLKEEKQRQMTIDLGFAWLTLPNGEEVGIVDVPGHIDFINNMLAGAGGIAAVLLVVAADEGVMPQTREHVAILDLLGVSRGVVALTKTDLVDEEWLALVEEDVRDLLRHSSLADAPIVPVSAVTGQGIDRLLAALQAVLAQVPPAEDRQRPRLPIDRVFTLSGFGTVVTGTLLDGALRLGQEVEILPKGLRGRVRGLQTHKRPREVALPGSRVAVNVSGVAKEEVTRGDVLTLPGLYRTTVLVDAQLRVLPEVDRPLEHNDVVHFFVGTTQAQARLRLLGTDALEPGETGWAQLVLDRPVVVTRGDRFILRWPSPSMTVGGGVVVDPLPGRKHKRFRPDTLVALEQLVAGSPEILLEYKIARHGPAPLAAILARCDLTETEARHALEKLVQQGRVVLPGGKLTALRKDEHWVFTRAQWEEALACVREAFTAYHREHPLRRVLPRDQVAGTVGAARAWPPAVVDALVHEALAQGWLVEEAGGYRLADHAPAWTPDQRARAEALLAQFRAQPFTPPKYAEAVAQAGEDVVEALIEEGTLVRVSDEVLFLRETYELMRERVVRYLEEHGRLTVAEARDLLGSSRKYVVPFLEHLDALHVTRRVGDYRVLRRAISKEGASQ